MRADLHCHTTYSDGKLTLDEVLDRAINNKVDILAITDHDCVEGARIAFNTTKPIKVIYGCELSTERLGESVHILGYFKKPLEEGPLLDNLAKQRKTRTERAYKMVELLDEKFNIKLDNSFIKDRTSITRGTIGDEIIKQGYNYTKKEIFDKMIGNGCPAYIPATKMTPEYGIKLIHDNGGIAVLAHPCLLKKNHFYDIIKMGVDGLEGIYPSRLNDEAMFRRFARNNNLLITAGSDFHYPNDSGHGEIGQCTITGVDLDKYLEKLGYER